VFDVGRNNDITWLEIDGVSEKVEAFCAVAGKDDLFLECGIEKFLNFSPGLLDFFCGLHTKKVIGSSVTSREILVVADNSIYDLSGLQGHTGVVKIDGGLMIISFLQWWKIHP
jgi:hypothetical protein